MSERFFERLEREYAPPPMTPSRARAFDEELRARIARRRPAGGVLMKAAVASSAVGIALAVAFGWESAPDVDWLEPLVMELDEESTAYSAAMELPTDYEALGLLLAVDEDEEGEIEL